jgi:DEAD/DEAH box helicase domain-containing protein
MHFHGITRSSSTLIQAINTVLGFVSSRKQLATTFPVVRLSVEALLKQWVFCFSFRALVYITSSPLDLEVVAELK